MDRVERILYTRVNYMKMNKLASLRKAWNSSSLGTESCFHQLSPYIGKLKSSIATALIEEFTSPGDLILEPFSGSGVIPLEAVRLGRNVVASDLSDYAAVLTRAKIHPPKSEAHAIQKAVRYVHEAKRRSERMGNRIKSPVWVRSFFHPKTLAETKHLCDILMQKREWFLLACVLGILHHQRPGFLSYPSSHLVPYLRTKKFPRSRFPLLYEYRDPEPRLVAKIRRAYRRHNVTGKATLSRFVQRDVRSLRLQIKADALITSPPYMNALDYGRDNRLRLWFIGSSDYKKLDSLNRRTVDDFAKLMEQFSVMAYRHLKADGNVVLVVGEVTKSKNTIQTKKIVKMAFEKSKSWELVQCLLDFVPDVRRSRRDCKGTKREWIMVFRKRK